MLGTAKAATFSGTRTLKGRRLKKGAYRLAAAGKVAGRALAYSRNVTLEK